MSSTVATAVLSDVSLIGVAGAVKVVPLKLLEVTPSFAAAMFVRVETLTDLSWLVLGLGSTAKSESDVPNATGCKVRSSKYVHVLQPFTLTIAMPVNVDGIEMLAVPSPLTSEVVSEPKRVPACASKIETDTPALTPPRAGVTLMVFVDAAV